MSNIIPQEAMVSSKMTHFIDNISSYHVDFDICCASYFGDVNLEA